MSVNFYLVCHQCRQKIHVAQDGFSGWSFYSGEPGCMRKLSDWFSDHAIDSEKSVHRFVLHSEHVVSSEDYEELPWSTVERKSP
jgi:hypothetical protein